MSHTPVIIIGDKLFYMFVPCVRTAALHPPKVCSRPDATFQMGIVFVRTLGSKKAIFSEQTSEGIVRGPCKTHVMSIYASYQHDHRILGISDCCARPRYPLTLCPLLRNTHLGHATKSRYRPPANPSRKFHLHRPSKGSPPYP